MASSSHSVSAHTNADSAHVDSDSLTRIVVLISGSGSNLQAIIDKINNGRIERAQICAVISNKADVYGLTRARDAQIDAVSVVKDSAETREEYDIRLANVIDQYQPDLLVLAGFMRILSAQFVHRYLGKMLNIHPSLLPKYKGLHTHQRALDNGDVEHGVTVHFVTPELDGGPIVAQAAVAILEDDTADILAARVQEQEHELYPRVIQWFCQGRIRVDDKGHALLDERPIHYSKPSSLPD